MSEGEAASERLLAAAIETVAEHGFGEADEILIARRAGIAPSEIELRFGSREELFAAARARIAHGARMAILAAYESGNGPWRERLRAAMRAAAHWLRENPASARWALRELEHEPASVRGQLRPALAPYVELVDHARAELDDPRSVPKAVAENVVGMVAETAVMALRRGEDAGDLMALVPGAMYMAVLPYHGFEAAAEELRRDP